MNPLLKLSCIAFWTMSVQAHAQAAILTERLSPEPVTSDKVPHVQMGVRSAPKYNLEVIRSIGFLDGVLVEATSNSLAGSRGFRLSGDIKPARPESLLSGNEFAHLHADGSLHAFLKPELAKQAVSASWATYHPWAPNILGWDGYVMIYTPTTFEELDVVIDLVSQSYNYAIAKK